MSKDYLKQTVDIELESLRHATEAISEAAFLEAVRLLCGAQRIGASGCGHSGIACRHFAHLMCCAERPARFLSPSEAVHGACGFLQEGDVMLFVSRGGQTQELIPIARVCRERGVKIITITEAPDSALGELSDVVLKTLPVQETDRFHSQGTTSTTLACVIFHALQAAVIEETGFRNEQFARIHPAGAVGQRLRALRDADER